MDGSSNKRTTKNRWWNCVQRDINKCKSAYWKERSQNRADWDKSIDPLTPNVNYSGRTAPLTYKVAFYVFIKQI